jgi:hypothetical protein
MINEIFWFIVGLTVGVIFNKEIASAVQKLQGAKDEEKGKKKGK